MRSMVAASVRSMPRNSVDRDGRSRSSITVNRLELELTGAIQLALSRSGISNKDAALTMGIDPAQWSRQLHGENHISFQRLAKLAPVFWRAFVPLLMDICDVQQTSSDPRWELLMALVRAICADGLPARTTRQLKVDPR